jgi:molecular chaperone GrpE
MIKPDDIPPVDEEATVQQNGQIADATDQSTETKPSGIEMLLSEQKDRYLRLAADYDNYRKRAMREREGAENHGRSIVVRGLFDALDDLARFAHLDAAKTDAATVIAGAAMVEQKLLKSLAGHGLEVINPVGQPFDPAVHEAVSTTPAASAEEDHLIAQVYQVGFTLNGQLLRPARVVVKQWAG